MKKKREEKEEEEEHTHHVAYKHESASQSPQDMSADHKSWSTTFLRLA